jgi:predicted nicotinamide N-methyase
VPPLVSLKLADGRKADIRNNDSGRGELGSRVWDGAQVLGRYIQAHPELVKGRRCVELGSGTGLGGVASAMFGPAEIVLSDKQALLPLIRYNVAGNYSDLAASKPAPRIGVHEVRTFDCIALHAHVRVVASGSLGALGRERGCLRSDH